MTNDTRWYAGQSAIPTYSESELLGTKIRALYQRRKGRDLFDLWYSHSKGLLNPADTVTAFLRYMEAEEHTVSKQTFVNNLQAKLKHPAFLSDTPPLLRPGIHYDPQEAAKLVETHIFPLLPQP